MFTSGGQIDLLSFAGMRGGGGKGGGGGQAPPPPRSFTDPVSGRTFSDSEQLNAEITQREASERATSDTATAKKTADDAAALEKFQGSKQSAYDSALAATQRAFQLQGADPNTYLQSDILPTLNRQLSSIQDLDPNPGAAFPASLGETIVGNVTSGKRTGALNALNQTFTPNYSSNLLPDSTVGSYVSDLVNEQFNPLTQQLQNAQRRNTLTGPGYSAALDALNQKKSAATATVSDLGRGILAGDRSSLDDYISGARSSANNLTLGGNFDPSEFIGGAAQRGQTDLAQFGGALRNAVGGTKFADIQELINAGGSVQGANNPNAANPAGGVRGTSSAFVPDDVLAQRQRGLGNTGAF